MHLEFFVVFICRSRSPGIWDFLVEIFRVFQIVGISHPTRKKIPIPKVKYTEKIPKLRKIPRLKKSRIPKKIRILKYALFCCFQIPIPIPGILRFLGFSFRDFPGFSNSDPMSDTSGFSGFFDLAQN